MPFGPHWISDPCRGFDVESALPGWRSADQTAKSMPEKSHFLAEAVCIARDARIKL
jgi:hypothetical protein